jgi:hypothetical protein
LIDKILATPCGGTLAISPAEGDALMQAVTQYEPKGGGDLIREMQSTGRAVFLSRTLVVNATLQPARGSSAQTELD